MRVFVRFLLVLSSKARKLKRVSNLNYEKPKSQKCYEWHLIIAITLIDK